MRNGSVSGSRARERVERRGRGGLTRLFDRSPGRVGGKLGTGGRGAVLARREGDDAPKPLQELGRFDITRGVVVRGVSVVRRVRGLRAGAGRNRLRRASLAHRALPWV